MMRVALRRPGLDSAIVPDLLCLIAQAIVMENGMDITKPFQNPLSKC